MKREANKSWEREEEREIEKENGIVCESESKYVYVCQLQVFFFSSFF